MTSQATNLSDVNSRTPMTRVGARTIVPPPYECRDTKLWAFLVRADREHLDDLCVRAFAIPTGGAVQYEAIGKHVLMTFGHIPHIASKREPFNEDGEISEAHAGVWVVVRRTAGDGPEFAVFNPYMWVDNPTSLVGGREYFGYAKSWGQLTNGTVEGADVVHERDAEFSLQVLGGNQRQPRSQQALIEIAPYKAPDEDISLEAIKRRSLPDVVRAAEHTLEHLLRDAQHALHVGAVLQDLSELLRGSIPQVFSKQIPDASGNGFGRVEICTADITVTSFLGEAVFEDHQLTVNPLFSDPLIEDLGLPVDLATGKHHQTLARGFYVASMDITLNGGCAFWDSLASPIDEPSLAPSRAVSMNPPIDDAAAIPNEPFTFEHARAHIEVTATNPWMRMQFAQDFYASTTIEHHAFNDFRTAQSAFMMWELVRGVLNPPSNLTRPGSAWWRAVNQDLLADQLVATRAWEYGTILPANSNAAKWRRFLEDPTPQAFYLAHNSSIVCAYFEHAHLAARESIREQALINQALARVLLVQAITAGAPIYGGKWVARLFKAFGGTAGEVVQIAVALPQLYPPQYPLTGDRMDTQRTLRRHHPLRGPRLTGTNNVAVRVLDEVFLRSRLRELFAFAARELESDELLRYLTTNGREFAYPQVYTKQPVSDLPPVQPQNDSRMRRPK